MLRESEAVAAALISCAVAGGCGDAGTSPLEDVVNAVSRTLEARTARGSFTITAVGPPAADSAVDLRGDGAFDLANRIGSMRINAADLRVHYVRGDIDVVVHGPVHFLRVPEGVPLGRPWLSVDHRTLGSIAVDPLAFDQLLVADPATALRYLRGAVGEVGLEGGTEVVRGVETTRYEMPLDLRRAAEQAPADLGASIGRLISRFQRSRMAAAVWIDDDERVRRLELRLGSARVDASAFVFREELYDFGVRVTVGRPAPDQVAGLPDLLALPPPRPPRRR